MSDNIRYVRQLSPESAGEAPGRGEARHPRSLATRASDAARIPDPRRAVRSARGPMCVRRHAREARSGRRTFIVLSVWRAR